MMSIFDEAVRIHLVRLSLIEEGFTDLLQHDDFHCVAQAIVSWDVDRCDSSSEWLADLKRTIIWLRETSSRRLEHPDVVVDRKAGAKKEDAKKAYKMTADDEHILCNAFRRYVKCHYYFNDGEMT